MTTYLMDYTERTNTTWTREIEADSLGEAQSLMLEDIQGVEPDHVDVINSYWEDGDK